MDKKRRSIVLFLLSILVMVGLALVLVFGITIKGMEKGSARNITLGLDLEGGVSITYQAVGEYTEEDMRDTLNKLTLRAEEFSSEAAVYMEGDNRITVDIPGEDDADAVLEQLGKPGSLVFMTDYGTEKAKVWVDGSQIVDAQPQAVLDETTGQRAYVVSFEMDSNGSAAFAEATGNNIGNFIYVVYDGEVISAPVVREAIVGGSGQIDGMESFEAAEDLASMIRIGSLKVELEELTHKVVGAKLGSNVIQASLLAAICGIAIIGVFMIAVYRVPGVAAALALIFYVEANLLSLNGFDLTLTLSGIAGVILSIGMAVDANIIIYTRIKEEITAGESIESAIKIGFKKASSAILDGNITTFIAAIVLMAMSSGTIKGFAQTLAIGTALSVFNALVISRWFVTLLVNMGLNKPGMFGTFKERKERHIIEKRKIAFVVACVLVISGFVGMAVNKSGAQEGRNRSLNYSVEFEGGINLTVDFDKKYSIDEFNDKVLPVICDVTKDAEAVANEVVGSNEFSVKLKTVDAEVLNILNDKLTEEFDITNFSYDTVGATLSNEMRKNAIVSVIVALICMLIYIFIRFRDMKYALSAVITLVINVMVVFAFYSLSYTSVGNTFIAVMLTILGYTINDTIVIFDRVREIIKESKVGDSKLMIGNKSIAQTMTRTVYTSLTSFVTIFFLYMFGVSALKEFTMPLMVGILFGMVSNIFIPCALWYSMSKKKEITEDELTTE